MRQPHSSLSLFVISCMCLLTASPITAESSASKSRLHFLQHNPGVSMYEPGGRVSRIYGRAFSHGSNALASADRFVAEHGEMFGIAPDDLVLDEAHTRPIMLDAETGRHKFTVVSYEQRFTGIAVHEARLILLARNTPSYPLVLASSTLRDLSDFEPRAGVAESHAPATQRIGARMPGAIIESVRRVVWAGSIADHVEPRIVWQIIAMRGEVGTSAFERADFIVDAVDNEVIHEESLVRRGIVSGQVNGVATEGFDADICAPESSTGLPYVEISIDGEIVHADETGAFDVDVDTVDPATIEAMLRNQSFRVVNLAGRDSVIAVEEPLPASVELLFNPLNEEFTRAEVNAYLHANIVRDYILEHVPDFPGVSTQKDFQVRVNSGGECDAFFDGVAINFLQSSPRSSPFDCPNSAHSTVVYHEYGHFVHAAGFGGSDWGEGMADTIAVLVSDDPDFSTGHFGDCDVAIRSAESGLQFPCGSGDPHTCGQIVSGSVWDTRNALALTNPDNAREIVTTLTLNSILIHGPEPIDPGLTIDFLTLDDDNGDLSDGTPHYAEIAEGFGAHNLDAPPLVLLEYEFPNDIPEFISPENGVAIQFDVMSTSLGEPDLDTVQSFVDTGGGFTPAEVHSLGGSTFEAVLPASDCGTEIRFYLSMQTLTGDVQTFPPDAPDGSIKVFSADGAGSVITADDLESDTSGWVASQDTPIFGGIWQLADPNGTSVGGVPAAPEDDATPDPGTMAYITQNGPVGGAATSTDVDGGPVYLESPIFNLIGQTAFVEYAAWFFDSAWPGSAAAGALYVDVSNDGGKSWVLADMVTGTDAQWETRRFSINHFVAPTSEVRIRFRTFDSLEFSQASTVEAGVDDVRIIAFDCADELPADFDGDGVVGPADLASLLGAWGPCAVPDDCPHDLDGDRIVNAADLAQLLGSWS